MGKYSKLREKILSGAADTNIDFSMLCQLLVRIGFQMKTKGSHHIFTHEKVSEIINIQPIGKMTKVYQVKQVRSILLKYKLGDSDVD